MSFLTPSKGLNVIYFWQTAAVTPSTQGGAARAESWQAGGYLLIFSGTNIKKNNFFQALSACDIFLILKFAAIQVSDKYCYT